MWNKGADLREGEVLGEKLRHYHFNDLYISNNPDEPTLFRRLALSGSGERVMDGVHPAPRSLKADLDLLFAEIRKAAMADGHFKRETQIMFDGVAYRGALMARPDAENDNPYETEEPDLQTWCLRRTGGNAPFLEDLRMPLALQKELLGSVNKRGLVLIAGSFGSGKTTTAAACIQSWVRQANEIGITIEDPPEFPLAVPEGKGHIYQIDITDRDPAVAIKYMRRHAPRYVFLGEIRTPDAARELLHMSSSGPLVLCTIHASDPIKAITSLIQFASSAMETDMAQQLVARCLSLVVHQELVNGTMNANFLTIGDDDFGMQSKIRSGRYDLLYEDFENQKVRRQNAAQANRPGVRR